MKAVYFGHSAKMIDILINHFELEYVVYEKKCDNIKLINMCEWHEIPYCSIESRNDISRLDLPSSDVGISYGIGIIFKSKEIGLFEHGIWNIHPGSLPQYRGRHPISWAMINNEKKIEITIHSINEDIDRGLKLSSDFIQRSIDDNETDITKKALNLVNDCLIDEAKKNYEKDLTESIGKGKYYKNLVNGFDEIDPSKVTSIYLFNLLRSQSIHGGVKILGKSFITGFYYNKSDKSFFKESLIVKCKDGKEIGLFEQTKKL